MGVLPPLLYSAAVSLPAMDFRRDLRAISSLSVVLVVVSAVVIGVFLDHVCPGRRPRHRDRDRRDRQPDRRRGDVASSRASASLPAWSRCSQGESLLNDATALVLLRSALAATAASVSLMGVVGDFVFAVAIAVAVGLLVGRLNLMVRSRITDADGQHRDLVRRAVRRLPAGRAPRAPPGWSPRSRPGSSPARRHRATSPRSTGWPRSRTGARSSCCSRAGSSC